MICLHTVEQPNSTNTYTSQRISALDNAVDFSMDIASLNAPIDSPIDQVNINTGNKIASPQTHLLQLPKLNSDTKDSRPPTCIGCGGSWKVVGQGRAHATGYCKHCRENTVAGKEALRKHDRAQEAKRRDDKKVAGTYIAYNKQRVQTNLKRRHSMKSNEPVRYQQMILDPHNAYFANNKANHPDKYERQRQQMKEADKRLKDDVDGAWIAYITLKRAKCVREGCDVAIPCCMQFNHIDPSLKSFNMGVNEFANHARGTSAEWMAEECKVEVLCGFHHIDVTCSNVPLAIDDYSTCRSTKDKQCRRFKLESKVCTACVKELQLASPGFVQPNEMGKFHIDHISRSTKTTRRLKEERTDVTDQGLQLLCAHCHYMKTAGECFHIFGTQLSTYYWNTSPQWFRTWFEINTKDEDWVKRREDWAKNHKEGKVNGKQPTKRRKLEPEQREVSEDTDNENSMYGCVSTDESSEL